MISFLSAVKILVGRINESTGRAPTTKSVALSDTANLSFEFCEVIWQNIMQVKYDKGQDILYVSFSNDAIFESDEEKQGMILDYAAGGKIVGIELLNASKQVMNPAKVEYEVA